MTGAAADVEDALAGLGGEEREKVAAELPDEGVRSVVESGVPVRRHLPIVAAAARHGNGPILARLLDSEY